MSTGSTVILTWSLLLMSNHVTASGLKALNDVILNMNEQMRVVEMAARRRCTGCHDTPGGTLESIITKSLNRDICDVSRKWKRIEDAASTCKEILEPMECGQQKLDVIFVLDESSSITEAEYELAKQFVKDIIGYYDVHPDRIQIALVSFSENPNIRFLFNTFPNNKAAAQALVMSFIKPSGGLQRTFTNKALNKIRSDITLEVNGDRKDVKNLIVMMTDGGSTRPENTVRAYNNLDKTNTEIFVVATGHDHNITELNLLASDPPEEHIFFAGEFSALADLRDQVVQFACPTCDPDCPDGSVCIRARNVCTCKKGFLGDQCQVQDVCDFRH